MAKLKHEFNRIVRYFDKAVALARFSGLKNALIHEAREASWTRASKQNLPDPLAFRLPLAPLARDYECDTKELRKAHDDLIATRVFIPLDDGSFRINKNFHDWVNPRSGEPLFSPIQFAILDGLRDSSGSLPKGGLPPSRGGENPLVPDFPLGGENPPSEGGKTPPKCPPPQPPHIIPPPGRREEEEEGGVSRARTKSFPKGSADAPEATPRPPEPASTPEQIADLRIWAEGIKLDLNYTYWATEQAKVHPAEWVKALLSAKVVGAIPAPPISYLVAILQRFQRQGCCEYLHTNGHLGNSAPTARRETKAERRVRELHEETELMKARMLGREARHD